MWPSSCSSIAKTRLEPFQAADVWNSSPSAPVDTETLPSIVYFCTACPDVPEPREIDVSTVSSESFCSIRSVTSPLRFGWQRALSCFHRPEKSGTVCGHAMNVIAESRSMLKGIFTRRYFSFLLLLIRNLCSFRAAAVPAATALTIGRLKMPTARQIESRAGFPTQSGSRALWCSPSG